MAAAAGWQIVKFDIELGNARRAVHLESKHLLGIAAPGDCFAIGGKIETYKIRYRACGPVLSRQPLGIKQVKGAGLNGHREAGVENSARRIAEVNVNIDYRGRLLCDNRVLEREGYEHCQYRCNAQAVINWFHGASAPGLKKDQAPSYITANHSVTVAPSRWEGLVEKRL